MTAKRILLVDDEPHVTHVLKLKLSGAGYAVECARTGADALTAAAANAPDLVITDLQMPAMNGAELAARLRETPGLSSVPVVMVTSRGHRVDEELRSRTNIVRIVPKPFSAKEVLALVTQILRPEVGSAAA